MQNLYDKQFRYENLIDQFHNTETKIDGMQFFYKNKDKILSWYNYDAVISITLLHFIEQVTYEIKESSHNNDVYIIDMLYRKAETYLAFMKGLLYYEQFLLIHNLIYDDVLIIWRHSLLSLRDRCVNDFYEQKSLQYTITSALLAMPDESLIPFFYDIALSSEADIAISAIVGLSLFRKKFANWKKLYKGDNEYDAMISLAASDGIHTFNIEKYSSNIYVLFFYCRYAEMFSNKVRDMLLLMDTVLHTIPDNHILHIRSVESIEHVLYRLTHREFNHFTDDDLLHLISVFNVLPPDSVHGIVNYWHIPKSDFIFTIQRVIHNRQINLDDCSNIATLLCNAEFA